jgi:hypothetical protein
MAIGQYTNKLKWQLLDVSMQAPAAFLCCDSSTSQPCPKNVIIHNLSSEKSYGKIKLSERFFMWKSFQQTALSFEGKCNKLLSGTRKIYILHCT